MQFSQWFLHNLHAFDGVPQVNKSDTVAALLATKAAQNMLLETRPLVKFKQSQTENALTLEN